MRRLLPNDDRRECDRHHRGREHEPPPPADEPADLPHPHLGTVALSCRTVPPALSPDGSLPRPVPCAEARNGTRPRRERVTAGPRTLRHRRAPAAPIVPGVSPPSTGASGPIFLAGVDRSGIGLLGELLECHPAVSMTRRTNFWAFYAGRFGSLANPHTVDRCLDEMMRNARMRVLEPDDARLQADLAHGAPTYERLFELLQLQLMERRGRTRWGDKSLGAERYARTILSAYPTAAMVHVLRDPRDRYASHDRHRQPRRSGVGHGAAMWQWSERLRAAEQPAVRREVPRRALRRPRVRPGRQPRVGPRLPPPRSADRVDRSGGPHDCLGRSSPARPQRCRAAVPAAGAGAPHAPMGVRTRSDRSHPKGDGLVLGPYSPRRLAARPHVDGDERCPPQQRAPSARRLQSDEHEEDSHGD